jgi:Sugar (and other) transporter
MVIANLYGEGDIHNDKARQEYREIKMGVLVQRQEGERGYSEMFKKYSKRVFIAMSAQAAAQLNGINVISYYAPLVFESAGWYGRDAILMTGINAITYLLATIPPWYLVDKWGRRKILLSGALAMVASLSLIAYFLYLDIKATPTLVVIFVMIYNAAFGVSWGPIPWLYPPEILPLSIRAKGASLSTATNWAFNWLVGEVTPILQKVIKWRLYLLHAFFCAASFVLGASASLASELLTNVSQCISYTLKPPTFGWKTWTSCLGTQRQRCQHHNRRRRWRHSCLPHDHPYQTWTSAGAPGGLPLTMPFPA